MKEEEKMNSRWGGGRRSLGTRRKCATCWRNGTRAGHDALSRLTMVCQRRKQSQGRDATVKCNDCRVCVGSKCALLNSVKSIEIVFSINSTANWSCIDQQVCLFEFDSSKWFVKFPTFLDENLFAKLYHSDISKQINTPSAVLLPSDTISKMASYSINISILNLCGLITFSTFFFVKGQLSFNPYSKVNYWFSIIKTKTFESQYFNRFLVQISPVFRPDENDSPLAPVYVRSSDPFKSKNDYLHSLPTFRKSNPNEQHLNKTFSTSHRPSTMFEAEQSIATSRSSQSVSLPAVAAASPPVAATPASGRRNQTSPSSSSAKLGPMDELREKVMEQVYEKLRIFASAFLHGNGRQDIKKRVPVDAYGGGIPNINVRPLQSQMLWASRLPFLRPLQNNGPVAPINPNTWCGSVHSAFLQYTQLNIWLLAAFILFPVTIPLYFTGFFVLLLFRAAFCATGWKHVVGNIVFRLANLNYWLPKP